MRVRAGREGVPGNGVGTTGEQITQFNGRARAPDELTEDDDQSLTEIYLQQYSPRGNSDTFLQVCLEMLPQIQAYEVHGCFTIGFLKRFHGLQCISHAQKGRFNPHTSYTSIECPVSVPRLGSNLM